MQKIAPEDPTPSNDKFPSFPQIRYIPPEIAPTVTPSFRFFGVRIKDHPENEPLVAPAPTAVQSSISDDEDLDDEDVQERPRFIQPTEVVFKKGRVAGLAIDPDLLGLIQEQQTSQHLCRSLAQSMVCVFMTAVMERWMVMWMMAYEDYPNAGALINVYKSRANPLWRHTYPIVVPMFLIDLSIVYLIVSLFLYFCKGNIKKDWVLWLAVVTQLGLTISHYYTENLSYMRRVLIFGPFQWDGLQLMLSCWSGIWWTQWRLYNLRLLLIGKKWDVTSSKFKKAALDFCM
ncbi:hypothetical protein Fcan01_09525 [Folsomia candida]|uniref:Uncharacterized protein n=1 Tax=Folsomia candida TaxID=158441 RepID=A0A226EHG0_FOLCA|nr:hypothetical protein Fcan01_09525 [Folsomia candida]